MGRKPGGSKRLTTTQLLLTNAVAALEEPSRSYCQEPVHSGSISTLSSCELNQLKELLGCALMCHVSGGSMIASVSHGWVGGTFDLGWQRQGKVVSSLRPQWSLCCISQPSSSARDGYLSSQQELANLSQIN